MASIYVNRVITESIETTLLKTIIMRFLKILPIIYGLEIIGTIGQECFQDQFSEKFGLILLIRKFLGLISIGIQPEYHMTSEAKK